MNWHCEVYGETRPDDKISTASHDFSKDVGLPKKCAIRNINHCNDNKECKRIASEWHYHNVGNLYVRHKPKQGG